MRSNGFVIWTFQLIRGQCIDRRSIYWPRDAISIENKCI